jgi:hypothetical protein
MKRIKVLTVLFACGLLATSTPLIAQPTTRPADVPAAPSAPKAPNWFGGNANMMLLGHEDVVSSKFQEYRDVPQGASLPIFTLQGRQSGNDCAIFAKNVSKKDQR